MEEFLPLVFLKNNNKRIAEEIIRCNETTKEYGLILSAADVSLLIDARSSALATTGRIEPRSSIVPKIIECFCDSPFLTQEKFTETIKELTELFFFYKNETLDLVSDGELIRRMNFYFNGSCQGSLELLGGRELNRFADHIVQGGLEIEEELPEAEEDVEHE